MRTATVRRPDLVPLHLDLVPLLFSPAPLHVDRVPLTGSARTAGTRSGLNLLLVHLDEVVATRNVSAPLGVTRQGLEWPE